MLSKQPLSRSANTHTTLCVFFFFTNELDIQVILPPKKLFSKKLNKMVCYTGPRRGESCRTISFRHQGQRFHSSQISGRSKVDRWKHQDDNSGNEQTYPRPSNPSPWAKSGKCETCHTITPQDYLCKQCRVYLKPVRVTLVVTHQVINSDTH